MIPYGSVSLCERLVSVVRAHVIKSSVDCRCLVWYDKDSNLQVLLFDVMISVRVSSV